MNLKEVKNILKNSKYLSKVQIEDDFEINGTISLWNRNDVDIIIEFDDEDENDINFSEATLKLIEDKLNWIDKNKKLICKTFIEEEGMFYGLNDEIEKQLSKKEKAKIDDLEFSAPLTEEEFSNSLYIAYINFYIGDEDDISCNFDLDCEPDYLFGKKAINIYRVLVMISIFIGSTQKVDLVWELADLFNGLMVIPNLIALLLLNKLVLETSDEYDKIHNL